MEWVKLVENLVEISLRKNSESLNKILIWSLSIDDSHYQSERTIRRKVESDYFLLHARERKSKVWRRKACLHLRPPFVPNHQCHGRRRTASTWQSRPWARVSPAVRAPGFWQSGKSWTQSSLRRRMPAILRRFICHYTNSLVFSPSRSGVCAYMRYRMNKSRPAATITSQC